MSDAVLQFEINHQTIRRTDNFEAVAKSHGYLFAKFSFLTDEWTSVSKTALFSTKELNYAVLLDENDMCEVPWEVLAESGYISVSVYGGTLITVNKANVYISPTGYTTDIENASEPTPDIFEQVMHYLDAVRDAVAENARIAQDCAHSASVAVSEIENLVEIVQGSESSAASSAQSANLSAQSAQTSSETAVNAMNEASAKAEAANRSQESAYQSQIAAKESEDNAAISETNAKSSEDVASEKADYIEEVYQTTTKYDGGTFDDWKEGD